MATEDLLFHVGDSGRFQIFITILYVLLSLLSTPHNFMENFTAATPAHHCQISLLDNPTSKTNIPTNLTSETLLRVSIPMGPNQKPEQCRRFRQTQWHLLDPDVPGSNNTDPETEPCLDGWTYDRSVFTSTIVTEWDLVCDFQSFKYFAQTISMAGFLLGATITGMISDRFGRKFLLVSSCLASGILGTCLSFAPIFSLYCVLKFFLSASLGITQNTSFVLLLEGTSQKWRPTVVTLSGFSRSLGQALLGVLAYLFPDWQMLQLVTALPFFIISLCLWWVVESVQWLMATGKTRQALKELQKIAYFNGKKDVAESLTIEMLRSKLKEDLNVPRRPFRTKEMITNPSLRRRVLCGSILIFTAVFSAYGLLLDIQILGKNIFLNQFLVGMIDIPSKLLTFFILKHAYRRPSIAFSLVVFGSSFLVGIFVSEEMYNLHLSVFLVGKASFAAFTSIFTAFNFELTPTVFRSTMNAIFDIAMRIAVIFSAFILITRRYFVNLPMIIYGISPIAASVCVFFLPETYKLPLVDSVKDMEKRDRLSKVSNRTKQRQELMEATER